MDSYWTDAELGALTPDRLEQVLLTVEGEVARLRGLQARLVREADRRQLPLGDGSRTLAEWVGARLDVTPETARSLVVVARIESAELDGILNEGDVSFDRVAEVAKSGGVDLGLHLDIGGLRRQAARHRRISRSDEIKQFGSRSLTYQRDLFGGSGRLWAEGPALDCEAMFTAIEQTADQLPSPPVGRPEPRSARRFDALHALCLGGSGVAATGEDPGAVGRSITTTVIVDAAEAAPTNGEAGAWIAAGPRIGPNTLEQVLCEGSVEVTARTVDGEPLAIGNAQAAISGRTRRWVLARDGGCVADGCASTTATSRHPQVRGR